VYPVSEAFLQAVQENARRYYWTGKIATKAGAVYPFGYEDIVKGSGYITAQCCGSSEIELGTVYAAEIEAMPNGAEMLSVYTENDIETYRDVLYFVAQILAGFFCINREGKLELRKYGTEPVMEVARSVLDMIPLYLSKGEAEGVRGDIVFAQSCLETGNFGFSGFAVTLAQNNFCGMGVTSNGMKGNSFETPQLGIRAQVQHLKAYVSGAALKNACVDPRFKYVSRGCAEYVEWLGQKENPVGKGWAAGTGYGEKILKSKFKLEPSSEDLNPPGMSNLPPLNAKDS